jgi:hypothetical protein
MAIERVGLHEPIWFSEVCGAMSELALGRTCSFHSCPLWQMGERLMSPTIPIVGVSSFTCRLVCGDVSL